MTPDSDAHEENDHDLIREFLKTRSEASFLRLYDRHTDRMYRFAARLAGGPGKETEDLVQEAWLRALGSLERFRGDSSLSTWLCGIVFNRWREVRNRESRDRQLWAGSIAKTGRFISGEKLSDEGRWCRMEGGEMTVAPPVADSGRGILAGYFVIGAADFDEAMKLANTCPHLKYGGSVEIRRIET